MVVMITDRELERRLLAERAMTGVDHYDEVWEGVYMMTPMPNDEHQQLVSRFVSVFEEIIGWPGLGHVRPGVNVSDRRDDWQQDYRVPDVAVFLAGGLAENRGVYWLGGPDFVVEILSPDDRTIEKLPFYSRAGVRELLLVNRSPWSVQLHTRTQNELSPTATADLETCEPITSSVLPFTFRMLPGDYRPHIEVTHIPNNKVWLV